MSGSGPSDYAAAIADQETAWWAALSDYEYAYALMRALEQASARGAPLHLARCVHHLQDLLRGLDPPDRTWVLMLVRRSGELLARGAGPDEPAVTVADLLAYLAGVATDPRFAPPSVLPVGLLHRLFLHGAGPEDLQEALDRQRYPHGKPLPVCPLCEPERADPAAPLTRAVAALPAAQHGILIGVGQALALTGHAPDLADQVAWVTGTQPVPAVYQALLTPARSDSPVTLAHALALADQP